MAAKPKAFNDRSTADIILKSSDGQSYHAHRAILAAYSGIFSDAGDCSSSTLERVNARSSTALEVVACSESSPVLGPLIRFMYRDETCPDPHTMEECDLFSLAEAAEKYDVWSLKQLLRTWMVANVGKCPAKIFEFALLHGYTALGVDAAVVGMQRRKKLDLSDFAQAKWVSTSTPIYEEIRTLHGRV